MFKVFKSREEIIQNIEIRNEKINLFISLTHSDSLKNYVTENFLTLTYCNINTSVRVSGGYNMLMFKSLALRAS